MNNKLAILNCMTVDVEDYFHVSAFSDVISPNDWDNYESRVERNTYQLLELFSEFNIKATFFVLGWVAERHPVLVRDIAVAGHEVACHGYSHQLVYNQKKEIFREETIRAKKTLEDITSKDVIGYRAASYSITKKSLWAFDILTDAGFIYDSSIFPILHDRYGIPDAKAEPHILTAPNGKHIIEFPLSKAKWFGIDVPVAGGGYFRLLPYFVTKTGLNQIIKKEKRPFIFYLHPWEIDTKQPKLKAKWLSRFRHYTNLGKTESRLKKLMNDYEFSTVSKVLSQIGY